MIGNDIIKKCKGLTLEVRTLRGLLYLNTNENDWVKVRDSEIWKFEQRKDDILLALKLIKLQSCSILTSVCIVAITCSFLIRIE